MEFKKPKIKQNFKIKSISKKKIEFNDFCLKHIDSIIKIQKWYKNLPIKSKKFSIHKPSAIKLDFRDIRNVRQTNNNTIVYQCVKHNNIREFRSNCNLKELDRTLDDLQFTFDEFWNKCREDDAFCRLSCRHLSKCSSRQGSIDEAEQLRICNITTQLCGVNIINLSSKTFRPTKDGNIISQIEMKQKNITKDCCLKSFDGKINGRMKGYIAAKVSFGYGGHQDNIFEEMDILANWWSNYKIEENEYLIILIDTDLKDKFTCLKTKYKKINNIKVFDHFELQEYIIDKYYDESI
jgi:hypothetical protein